MTQGTRKQTTEPILGTPILGMAILGTTAAAVSHAFPWCVRLSYDLIVFPYKSTDPKPGILD